MADGGATAVLTLATLAMQGYQTEQQIRTTKKGQRVQGEADARRQTEVLKARREAAVAENRARRQQPDVAALLAAAAADARQGVGSTFLSGQSGLGQLGV